MEKKEDGAVSLPSSCFSLTLIGCRHGFVDFLSGQPESKRARGVDRDVHQEDSIVLDGVHRVPHLVVG